MGKKEGERRTDEGWREEETGVIQIKKWRERTEDKSKWKNEDGVVYGIHAGLELCDSTWWITQDSLGHQQSVPEPQCCGCCINRRWMEMYRVLVYTACCSLLFTPPSIMIPNSYAAVRVYTHPSGTHSPRLKAGNQLSSVSKQRELRLQERKMDK